jgi:DNA mismatch endonuclease (patch repair protein)
MADKISAERRSRNMAAIRSGDTKPELAVRRMIHALGYRYRLHAKELPGKPDIVFRPKSKAIFVHGCFWHGCERAGCLDARKPKSNTGYWFDKLARNKARDARHLAELEAAGWETLVVWDCEIRDRPALEKRLKRFLGR